MQNYRSVKALCFNVHICFLFSPHCDDTLVGFRHENHLVRFRKTSCFGHRRGWRSSGFLLKTSGFVFTDTGGNCPEVSLKNNASASVKLQSPTETPPLCPLPPVVKVRWACNVYMDVSIQFVAVAVSMNCWHFILTSGLHRRGFMFNLEKLWPLIQRRWPHLENCLSS